MTRVIEYLRGVGIQSRAMRLARIGSEALYLLLLIGAGGSYFWIELFENYRSMDKQGNWIVALNLGRWLFYLTVGAAVLGTIGLFRRQKKSISIRCFLLVACAILSFQARFDLTSLADDVFFRLNERTFIREINASGGEAAAAIICGHESYNDTLFVYSPRALSEGQLSLEEINSLGGLLGEDRTSKIYARRLKDRFYVVVIVIPWVLSVNSLCVQHPCD